MVSPIRTNAETTDQRVFVSPELENLRCFVNKETRLTLKSVDKLLSLNALNLFGNYSRVPYAIGQLINLTEFRFGSGNLNELPPEIGDLKNLTILSIEGCLGLKKLPAAIGKLTNLTKLRVAVSEVEGLPAELGKLTKLTHLDVILSPLKKLPTELGKLVELTELSVFMCKLEKLPAEIGKLIKLTKLDVSSNKLKALSAEIRNLTKLTDLSIEHNKLKKMPEEIRNLTKLTKLSASRNKLKEIPGWVGQLTDLREFYISRNQLSALPSEIVQLTNLTRLNVTDNLLQELPLSLTNFSRECVIIVRENHRISEDAIGRFQEEAQRVCRLDPTRGPHLEADIYVEPVSAAADSLDEVLQDWIEEFKKALPEQAVIDKTASVAFFMNEQKCSKDQQSILKQFLARVSETGDFINGGISKRNVILRCYQMIKRAMENDDFRENLFPRLKDALGDCGDRVMLYFNFIEMEWHVSQKDMNTKKVCDILVGLNRADRLVILANERVKKVRHNDPVQVQLCYQVKLKDVLRLPISTDGMRYPASVEMITQEMLDEDAEKILAETNSKEQVIDILLHSDKWGSKWEEQIRLLHKERFDVLNGKMYKKMERINKKLSTVEYNEQLDLVRVEEKTRTAKLLKTLTEEWVEQNWQIPK